MATGERVGVVVHFFDRILVAVLRVDKKVRLGDRLHFLGNRTDLEVTVASMQVDHKPVQEAAAGSEVAVKLTEPVRRGDAVYLLKD
jgi:selenocysteine-specific translation elongation factor